MITILYEYFMANIETMLPMVIMMVSALIVFIGTLKPILFNKISNKDLRGVLLSLTSVVLAYVSVAIVYLIKQYSFDHYWVAGSVYCGVVIVVYWLYENTKLRAGIHKIGTFVLEKLFGVIATKVTTVANNTEAIGISIDNILNDLSISKNEIGKDLKNL